MKTYKRAIAVFVVFAFLTLLQVSAMPLRADQAPDQSENTVSSPEQGPSFVEEEGYSRSSSKKSIVPIILIGLGVAALAAVLVLVVFKTKYDIVGAWTVSYKWASMTTPKQFLITFSGDKKSGTFVYVESSTATGTYTVDGKNVQWIFTNGTSYTGTFTDKNSMSGTMTSGSLSGTWTATRNASAASLHPTLASSVGTGMNGAGEGNR